jgi:hypothetical protein
MTNEGFLVACRALGINGDGPDGQVCTTEELIRAMRADPVYLEEQKEFWEHVWQGDCQREAKALVQSLMLGARYLSDLAGASIPLLASRELAEASAGLVRQPDAEALLIGKAIRRTTVNHLAKQSQQITETILAAIQQHLSGRPNDIVPTRSKYLDTKQMAARLNLNEVTVARLCKRREIDADKTAGNQWRTTEDRLRRSPYLNGRKQPGKKNGTLE